MDPYFADEHVTLYHGNCLDVIGRLGGPVDCIVTDPPYGSTTLRWDRWPDGWLAAAAEVASSLWCWLPVRAFATPPYRGAEFAAAGWRLSSEVVWEKHNGAGFSVDRFKAVHEIATHWYRGPWAACYRDVPRVPGEVRPTAAISNRPQTPHMGKIGSSSYEYGPTRMARSVIRARSMHGRALHPTEKPVSVLDPLIRYAAPPGGLVLDLFAGSGSTGEAARLAGRRAVLVEADERYCERAAQRLQTLPVTVAIDARDCGGD